MTQPLFNQKMQHEKYMTALSVDGDVFLSLAIQEIRKSYRAKNTRVL
jgi:hypothetical protein